MAGFGTLATPYLPTLLEASRTNGIPLPLLAAQIMQESTFNPAAVSSTGAVGLGQILPSTARDPGYGVAPIDPSKLTDPNENIRFTASYLAARGKAAGVQDWNDPAQAAKGLVAYNGGGDPKYAENVFKHVQPVSMSTDAPAPPQPEQPSSPAPRPFFKPQTIPVRAGVDMDGISPGARGVFEKLTGLNIPGLEVVSGYRDPERNARAGGAKGSQHIHGNAIDINIEKLSPEQRQQVLDTAISAGARGIGIYPGGRSLHLDVRETPAAWGANASAPYSGVSDPNAYPEWARPGVAKLFGAGLPSQATAYAPADKPAPRPTPFAMSKESTTMASPADLAQGTTGSVFATPSAPNFGGGEAVGGGVDFDGLMMGLSLLASAIPNGKTAPEIGSVLKPFMDAQSRKDDRAYMRGKDARDYSLRKTEIDRAQSNTDRTFNLQTEANRRADEAARRAEAKPLIQQFKDAAGNTIYRQWNNDARTWDDLPTVGAPAPAPVTSATLPPPAMGEDVQGPPIPVGLMPAPTPAPAQPVAGIPAPPPGVNVEEWYKTHTGDLAKRSLPPSSEDATGLRKEIQGLPSYKNMSQAAPIYRSMFEAAGRDTKAADLNLVYGLGKIMDPGSVVREGEMIMVKNTGSLPDWLQGIISQVNGKAGLTPELRERIMQEAHGRMQGYQGQYDQDIQQYRGIVDRRKMNADDVIFNFGSFEPWKVPSSGTTPGATAPGTASPLNDGATRKVIGGKTYTRPKNSSSWFIEE